MPGPSTIMTQVADATPHSYRLFFQIEMCLSINPPSTHVSGGCPHSAEFIKANVACMLVQIYLTSTRICPFYASVE